MDRITHKNLTLTHVGSKINSSLPQSARWGRLLFASALSSFAFANLGSGDATLIAQEQSQTSAAPQTDSSKAVLPELKTEKLPSLPLVVTSFGAAIAGNSVYVVGGHMGDAHDYAKQNQNDETWMLNLSEPKKWEVVGKQEGLQGLGAVAVDNQLIRLGGFAARNEGSAKPDMHSVSSVARLNSDGQWEAVPDLPLPTSSFDAVVHQKSIFVAGGWQLRGAEETLWHSAAYRLDLSASDVQWQEIAAPGFSRRAHSLAAHDGKIYLIGGMDEKGPSKKVHIYDIASNSWSDGPTLPGGPLEGFGNAACFLGDKLYVSTISGTLYCLSADKQSWDSVGKITPNRYFHRMLPVGDKQLLYIGGTNREDGGLVNVELVTP